MHCKECASNINHAESCTYHGFEYKSKSSWVQTYVAKKPHIIHAKREDMNKYKKVES